MIINDNVYWDVGKNIDPEVVRGDTIRMDITVGTEVRYGDSEVV